MIAAEKKNHQDLKELGFSLNFWPERASFRPQRRRLPFYRRRENSSRCFNLSQADKGEEGRRDRERPESSRLAGTGCLFNNDDKWRAASDRNVFPFSDVAA